MLLRRLLLLGLVPLARVVFADVEFTRPAGGASVAGGKAIQVEWKETKDPPLISDLQSYTLFLCTGGNDNPIQLATIADASLFTTSNKASATIQKTLGASDPDNAYFLKMISVGKKGGQVVNYSERFSLTGMTGVFSKAALDGLKTVEGTDGPPTENQIAGQDDANEKAVADGLYEVAYTLQTGPTRYAPMQQQPPTKITAKVATPLFPTSSARIATTWLPPPVAVTTVTESPTYSVTSRENDASPAPHPNDDMAKYLARWKD